MDDQSIRGKQVIIKDFFGRPFLGKIWGAGDGFFFAVRPDVYEDLLAGSTSLSPVAFPSEDCFEFDEGWDVNDPDWDRLKPLERS